jgi:HEAT repeat protein
MKLGDILRPERPDIERYKERKDIYHLIQSLHYPEAEIQWQAAAALGEMGNEGIEPLLEAIKTRNKHVKLGIIEALGDIRDSRAVGPLLAELRHPDNEIRWEASLALGEIGDASAIPELEKGLKDDDRYVRYATALALEKLGWAPVDDRMSAYILLAKQEWKAIAAIGNPAIEPLSIALKDHDREIRQNAVHTLGEIGDPAAIPAIYRALRDPDGEVRWTAVKAAPKVGLSLMYLPRGLAQRPRNRKNPYIAGFLNFVLPGMGYFYLGKWWGIVVFQVDVYATTLFFATNGELETFRFFIPIYLVLAVHGGYMAYRMPDL